MNILAIINYFFDTFPNNLAQNIHSGRSRAGFQYYRGVSKRGKGGFQTENLSRYPILKNKFWSGEGVSGNPLNPPGSVTDTILQHSMYGHDHVLSGSLFKGKFVGCPLNTLLTPMSCPTRLVVCTAGDCNVPLPWGRDTTMIFG